MFDTVASNDFLFDVGIIDNKHRKNASKHYHPAVIGMNKRRAQIEMMTHFYLAENQRLRKACPVCNTLVKPELQAQHNDAYHPQMEAILPTISPLLQGKNP